MSKNDSPARSDGDEEPEGGRDNLNGALGHVSRLEGNIFAQGSQLSTSD